MALGIRALKGLARPPVALEESLPASDSLGSTCGGFYRQMEVPCCATR